ncbi:MAG: hypothetical protein IPK26_09120 [Planctomycetes bacterium]|nr:hypothetical protein [Planctomycetota bacterium]
MQPQGNFTIVARIRAGATDALRQLLASMNVRPGVVDPANAIVPFTRFPELHFARLVILVDRTADDLRAHGRQPPADPDLLAFLGDCDRSGAQLLDRLAVEAAPGLRRLFAFCEGFDADTDLRAWMQARSLRPAAAYVHYQGRTVVQAAQEAKLRRFLEDWLDANGGRSRSTTELHAAMQEAVAGAVAAGRLELAPLTPMPWSWRLGQTVHFVGGLLVALLSLPVLLLIAPLFLLFLRHREKTDPVVDLPAATDHVAALQTIEDHACTNQFTALGTVKPGWFRGLVLRASLLAVGFAARHVYGRGRLARVSTIHFARWVYLDGGRRLFFASNYDASLDSYMEDFINKVGFGLNLVFSNGIGYPRTRFLVLDGALHEQQFKRFIRRHQLPTEVYYNAHVGRTAVGMDVATAIRRGLEVRRPSPARAAAWLALFH